MKDPMHRNRVSALFRCAVPLLAALVLNSAPGCGGGRFSGPAGPAAVTLSTAGAQTEVASGAEIQGAALVTDFSGRQFSGQSVSWEVDDPTLMTAIPTDSTGRKARLIAGPRGGDVKITVRIGKQLASTPLKLTIIGPKVIEVSFERDVQPILTRTCSLPECHAGPIDVANEGLVTDAGQSYDLLVGVKAAQVRSGKVLRVDPGHSDASYLVAKLKGNQKKLGGRGSKMPLDAALPDADLEKIVKWIDAGAKKN